MFVARRVISDCVRLLGQLDDRLENWLRASGRGGTVAGKTRGHEIKKLSAEDVDQRLTQYERAYAAATGERLTSDDFYARFTAGEFDDRFGMRWATFYEAAQRARQPRRPAATVR